MTAPLVLEIAVPTPLRRSFHYLPPPDVPPQAVAQWAPGSRLRLPFGGRELVGVLLATRGGSDQPREKLKAVHALLDPDPLLPPDLLALLQWAADYYHQPPGEALASALPKLLREGEAASFPRERHWQLTTEGKGLPEGALHRAPRQSEALESLHRAPLSRHELRDLGIATAALRELEKKGLAAEVESEQHPAPLDPPPQLLDEAPYALNEEQSAALGQLRYGGFGCYLLEGATGSGKTEIYLQAIARVLEQGHGALVLVPEIGLTPQLIERFRRRFRVPVVALHSGMNDRERLDGWLRARHGLARVVIGTRSAIFTPLQALGIVVVDEEHDLSFKQQDGFRYSARDLAIVRAQREQVPVVLGTATPSLETLHNASAGRYQHLRLTRRAGAARPPAVELVDLRGRKLQEGFSRELLDAIGGELEAGNQALVFINRRGYAPVLICHDCGWVADCHYCSAKLTVHRHPPHLHCHHCDHQRPIPRQCPDCMSQDLDYLGQGSERSEAVLREHFPQVPVIRVDRDSTRGKRAMESLLERVHQGEPCILVGTQMLAKGHHFPDVTLVAMIDIDGGLFSGDFRGPERMGQLLIQVAGRAGRASKPGTVIIQSHHCEHPNIQSLVKEGYHRYARRLLRERQLAGLPPYRYLVLLRGESKRPENASAFLQAARELAESHSPASADLHYLGPLPALMERKNDRYCFQLHISCSRRPPLHGLLDTLCGQLENHPLARRVRWSVDVDPQDMS